MGYYPRKRVITPVRGLLLALVAIAYVSGPCFFKEGFEEESGAKLVMRIER